MGISAILRPLRAAPAIISVANSIPGVRGRIRWNASLVNPRMPQWKSPIGTWNASREMNDSTGFPR